GSSAVTTDGASRSYDTYGQDRAGNNSNNRGTHSKGRDQITIIKVIIIRGTPTDTTIRTDYAAKEFPIT
ncbi:hypothetical protein, partial [Pseudoalteromonas sp.]|uniref:hypothetical protein n=1 Tax=Pseudoalteromonas sp. TaxID=53249 RepID=UPI0026195047